jgi:hypothetical protein
LQRLGILSPTGSRIWYGRTVQKILGNPVYIGKIRWNERKTKKVSENGVVKKVRYTTPVEEQIIVDGLHPAIVSEEVFNRAAALLQKHVSPPVPNNAVLANPLAGILVCAKCGRTMSSKKSGKNFTLCCPNRFCDNVGAKCLVVEERLLQSLSGWLAEYRLQWDNELPASEASLISSAEKAVKQAEAELATLQAQLERTHDLLEQGVYDTDTFLERSRSLAARISSAEDNLSSVTSSLGVARFRAENKKNIIPGVEKLLEVYRELPSAQAKNDMLKEVLEKVEYRRDVRSGKNGPFDNFELVLYPKLPPSE